MNKKTFPSESIILKRKERREESMTGVGECKIAFSNPPQ